MKKYLAPLFVAVALLFAWPAFAQECTTGTQIELIQNSEALGVPVLALDADQLAAFAADPDVLAIGGEKPANLVTVVIVGYLGGSPAGTTFDTMFFDAAGCKIAQTTWNYEFIQLGIDAVEGV